MFHIRLLELEAEILAKEEAARGLSELTPECIFLLDSVEQEIETRLGDKAPPGWRGWLSYRRHKDSLLVCRGKSFNIGGMFSKHCAGFDVANGADAITDYQRGFDVSPPQDIDHLLLNFGEGNKTRAFLWYGENIAAYKLIFEASTEECHNQLQNAVVDACGWILKRPKHTTLMDYLKQAGTQDSTT